MNAAALPSGAAWDEDTKPERDQVVYSTPPVASEVMVAAKRAVLFVFASLGGLLLLCVGALWLFS